jgi:nitronate monooxygenase
MAGGITTPELIAAVSNQGGLGMLGAGYMQPKDLRQAILDIRSLTDKPFAVNLFVPGPIKKDTGRIIQANKLLAVYREQLGIDESELLAQEQPKYIDQIGVLFEESVEIISFTFGVPGQVELDTIKQLGITTIGTATHLLEAILLEESGLDIVVAQGVEAGGHRGTFLGTPEQGMTGSIVLLPLLADHLSIPFIAAGGIMDARGIVAALQLGAEAVQIGTAFLASPESGAHPAYKETLLHSTEMTTLLTRAFSGKLGRCLKNQFVMDLQQAESFLPDFPVQNALTQSIRKAAAEQHKPEFMSMWAGQGCAMTRDLPVETLMQEWIGQTNHLLGSE